MNSEVGCVRRQPCPLYFLSFHSCSVGVAYWGYTEVWLRMSLLGLLSFLMRGAGAWCWCLGFHPKSKPCNSISVASNCRSCIESDFTCLSARTWVFNSSGIMFIHTAPARPQKTIIQCLVPSSTPCLMNRVQLLAFLGAETKDMVQIERTETFYIFPEINSFFPPLFHSSYFLSSGLYSQLPRLGTFWNSVFLWG